jgi:hypothetical protein
LDEEERPRLLRGSLLLCARTSSADRPSGDRSFASVVTGRGPDALDGLPLSGDVGADPAHVAGSLAHDAIRRLPALELNDDKGVGGGIATKKVKPTDRRDELVPTLARGGLPQVEWAPPIDGLPVADQELFEVCLQHELEPLGFKLLVDGRVVLRRARGGGHIPFEQASGAANEERLTVDEPPKVVSAGIVCS